MSKVVVSEDCIGCGLCTSLSDLFEMGDEGRAQVLAEVEAEEVQEAIDSCPVGAISLEDGDAPAPVEEAPAEAPVTEELPAMDKYVCTVCHYTYDPSETGVAFEDLPDDWVCPWCGVGKDSFEKA